LHEIRIRSPHGNNLQELIESALANEARMLAASIRRTQEKLQNYETTHGLSTADFLRRYAEDNWDESLDSLEWLGEARLLERLQHRLTLLQDIEIAK